MTAIEHARAALDSAMVARRYGVQPNAATLERALRALADEYETLTAERDAYHDRAMTAEMTAREALTRASRLASLTATPADDELNDLSYLITAKRFQERGLRGAIGSPDLEVARPLAEFLLAEGYRRHVRPSDGEMRCEEDWVDGACGNTAPVGTLGWERRIGSRGDAYWLCPESAARNHRHGPITDAQVEAAGNVVCKSIQGRYPCTNFHVHEGHKRIARAALEAARDAS